MNPKDVKQISDNLKTSIQGLTSVAEELFKDAKTKQFKETAEEAAKILKDADIEGKISSLKDNLKAINKKYGDTIN